MKLLRVLLTALATLVVAGTVASASPPLRAAFDTDPTPEVSVAPDPTEPSETPAPEPTETTSPDTDATETTPPDDAQGEDASAAPDFTACEGYTGLPNAICRHEALFLLHPENVGLEGALAQLQENLARHADAEPVAEESTADADADATTDAASCPGKSCEPHGNSHSNGHGNH